MISVLTKGSTIVCNRQERSHLFEYIVFFLMIFFFDIDAKILSDSTFAFKTEIESQWSLSMDPTDTGIYYLRDDTRQRKAEISIRKISIDTISLMEESEYAKVFFLSNLIIARGLGTVQLWDSSKSLMVGNLRAYDLFAHYKATVGGTTKWYAEYARWCSKDTFVFELSVICDDLNEIKNNKSFYIGKLNAISVWIPGQQLQTSIFIPVTSVSSKTFKNDLLWFDLAGRKINQVHINQKSSASRIIIRNGKLMHVITGSTDARY